MGDLPYLLPIGVPVSAPTQTALKAATGGEFDLGSFFVFPPPYPRVDSTRGIWGDKKATVRVAFLCVESPEDYRVKLTMDLLGCSLRCGPQLPRS